MTQAVDSYMGFASLRGVITLVHSIEKKVSGLRQLFETYSAFLIAAVRQSTVSVEKQIFHNIAFIAERSGREIDEKLTPPHASVRQQLLEVQVPFLGPSTGRCATSKAQQPQMF